MRVMGRQSRADESRVPRSGNQSTMPAGEYVTHCKVPLHGAIGFVAPQEMLAGRQPQISPHATATRRPTVRSADSAASRLIRNHSSNHDARYNDFAR